MPSFTTEYAVAEPAVTDFEHDVALKHKLLRARVIPKTVSAFRQELQHLSRRTLHDIHQRAHLDEIHQYASFEPP